LSQFLPGDVNASRAKTASGLSAWTLFPFLIFFHHFTLGWHKINFWCGLNPDARHYTQINSLCLDNFLASINLVHPVLVSGNTPPLQAGSSLSRHNMSGLDARPSILPGRYASCVTNSDSVFGSLINSTYLW